MHSKGPWDVDAPGVPARPYIVAIATDQCYRKTIVARGEPTGGRGWPALGVGGISIEEARANARLIAASPELLAACEQAKVFVENVGMEDSTTYPMLVNAIAKATGTLTESK